MPGGGLPARMLELADALREEGLAVGTSELLDAFEALQLVRWTDQEDFREALATTLAKSPEDRRVFELVFDRFFFRAAEREAIEQGITEGNAAERSDGGEFDPDAAARGDPSGRPRRAPTASCATWRGLRSRPSAARARARA